METTDLSVMATDLLDNKPPCSVNLTYVNGGRKKLTQCRPTIQKYYIFGENSTWLHNYSSHK